MITIKTSNDFMIQEYMKKAPKYYDQGLDFLYSYKEKRKRKSITIV